MPSSTAAVNGSPQQALSDAQLKGAAAATAALGAGLSSGASPPSAEQQHQRTQLVEANVEPVSSFATNRTGAQAPGTEAAATADDDGEEEAPLDADDLDDLLQASVAGLCSGPPLLQLAIAAPDC